MGYRFGNDDLDDQNFRIVKAEQNIYFSEVVLI